MKKRLLVSVLFLIVSLSVNIYSQWSTDPTVNNPICTEAHTQEYPAITSDGSGGAIITWDDSRDGNFNIYAQRINSSGAALWAADGVAVCTQASNQYFASITSDGSSGAIITWQDDRNGNPTIYAQRIDQTGAIVWTGYPDGVAISTLSSGQWAPTITGDGGGGAIITWFDYRNGNNDIYAKRINASGVVQWTANGLAVCTQASHQYYPTITSDGSGGAIISWYDDRTGNQDIYAQRIDASGATQWTTAAAGGVAVCTNTSRQDNPTITFDGSHGAIITWFDGRAGNYDIYAQRIDASGATQWTTAAAGGVAVCTLTSNQMTPEISSDGSGGAIITWSDARNSTYYDIYAQRINSSGAALWTANGVAISTVGGKAQLPVITGDASGGIITWQDSRNASSDIYASGVSSAGVLPVELVSFNAMIVKDKVELIWQTATELNNYGFEVERSQTPQAGQASNPASGAGVKSETWQKIGFVNGHGNSNSRKNYSFEDKNPLAGKVEYRLKQIDTDGKFEYSAVVEVTVEAPADFSLNQNYPNPFNPTTIINYELPMNSHVTLKVYDVLGKEVATLVNTMQNAGRYSMNFSTSQYGMSSGIYFYRLYAGNYSELKKMVVLK